MSFKDMVAADLDSVFFDAEEHGELAEINNKEMTIITDSTQLYNAGKSPGEELANNEIIFYVRSSEMGHKPQRGREMKFNGRDYIVDFANDYDGMYHIKLQRFTG